MHSNVRTLVARPCLEKKTWQTYMTSFELVTENGLARKDDKFAVANYDNLYSNMSSLTRYC